MNFNGAPQREVCDHLGIRDEGVFFRGFVKIDPFHELIDYGFRISAAFVQFLLPAFLLLHGPKETGIRTSLTEDSTDRNGNCDDNHAQNVPFTSNANQSQKRISDEVSEVLDPHEVFAPTTSVPSGVSVSTGHIHSPWIRWVIPARTTDRGYSSAAGATLETGQIEPGEACL
ncbi:hypothetical protein TCAL_15252 [Tigriopus californicus]|uniref:Uncharacterized protein n=1 Tax=Tigriopus californicus TaxID=6832 RepID=A0A553NC29_TIGCA|nr:hypothetical protein TCAL_15252 [Tigriopus californicus]